jgi:hypothetical protein
VVVAGVVAGLRVTVSDHPDARYRVRVVQMVRDHRVRREASRREQYFRCNALGSRSVK